MIHSTKKELGSNKYKSSIKRNPQTGETSTSWPGNTIMWEKLR